MVATNANPEGPEGADDDKTFDVEWDEVQPASPVGNLPAGDYRCTVASIDPRTASTGTKGVRVIFLVGDGDHKGKFAPPCDIWAKGQRLTKDGLERAKRDLGYLGITARNQIDAPPKSNGVFIVTVTKDEESPLGKVSAFNPA